MRGDVFYGLPLSSECLSSSTSCTNVVFRCIVTPSIEAGEIVVGDGGPGGGFGGFGAGFGGRRCFVLVVVVACHYFFYH